MVADIIGWQQRMLQRISLTFRWKKDLLGILCSDAVFTQTLMQRWLQSRGKALVQTPPKGTWNKVVNFHVIDYHPFTLHMQVLMGD